MKTEMPEQIEQHQHGDLGPQARLHNHQHVGEEEEEDKKHGEEEGDEKYQEEEEVQKEAPDVAVPVGRFKPRPAVSALVVVHAAWPLSSASSRSTEASGPAT